MDSFDIEKEIKIAGETLNKDGTKLMEKCLKELTTTGSPSLDPAGMKQFKRFCRESDDHVRYAFLLIMKHLNKKHSEIRLSAFQVADELFNRSHAFREMVITHLQAFLALTTETEAERPLPPPRNAANKLKIDTLHAVQLWYDKYGRGYKKLAVGYNYLKNCKHVDFNDIRAQNQAEQKRLEDEKKRKQRIMADKLAKVLKNISELKPEIDSCVREAESCLQLLLPTPTDFMLHLPEDVDSGRTKYQERSVHEVCKQHLKSPDMNDCPQDKLADENKDVSHSETSDAAILFDQNLQNDQKPDTLSPDSCSSNRTAVDSPGLLKKSDNKQLTGINKPNDVLSICSKEDNLCQLNYSVTDNFVCVSSRSENITLKIASETNGLSEAVNECRKADNEDSSDTEYATDEDDDGEEMSVDEDDLTAHGLPNPYFSLVIELPTHGPVSIQVTKDNTDVVCSLRDACKLIVNNYLPKVIKWLEILGKNGAKEVDIKAAIDLKVNLENIKMKSTELQIVAMEDKFQKEDVSDDEEFEEVPEKEGYEPDIPMHLRAEYGLGTTPAPVKTISKPSSVEIFDDKVEARNHAPVSKHWNLKEKIKSEDISDPTSLASALARIRQNSLSFDLKNSPASSSTQQINSGEQSGTDAPLVQFGTDLAYWEKPDKIEAPSVMKLDSLHRFWTPAENEAVKPSQVDIAAVKNRVFYFTGKFEPVKWKCRTMMSNGKLCERMDHVKCPFHGQIIPRDKEGKPNRENHPSTSQKEIIKSENMDVKDKELPPWLDPELQREIEQATGHDLGSARSQKLLDKKTKGKGKGKSKKKSNLTDTNAITNTSRKRLGDKIFSKRSMRKVCSTLDGADYRRVREKFSDQFNYSLH